MSSVDGRLLPERWTPPFDGRRRSELTAIYAQIGAALKTDAWMFGLSTARAFLPLRFVPKSDLRTMPHEPYIAPRTSERLFVFAAPECDVYFNTDKVRGDDIAVILSEKATDEYLEHLRATGISYLFAGTEGTDLALAMETLREVFKVRRLSLQGGGIINSAMLACGVIDELSLVIYPGIDGRTGIPSIFEYIGDATDAPAEGQSLELLDAGTADHGVVWLRYKFHRRKGLNRQTASQMQGHTFISDRWLSGIFPPQDTI